MVLFAGFRASASLENMELCAANTAEHGVAPYFVIHRAEILVESGTAAYSDGSNLVDEDTEGALLVVYHELGLKEQVGVAVLVEGLHDGSLLAVGYAALLYLFARVQCIGDACLCNFKVGHCGIVH